ncbi:MAG: hypothetical protein ABIQ44_01795, partial [Chloroflexia bacterium]
MQDERSLSKIEGNCNQLLNSPYLQKEVPNELKNLRTVLEKVTLLVREDVPSLISEIRHLRNQNRKLEAELELMRTTASNLSLSSSSLAPILPEPDLPDPALVDTLVESPLEAETPEVTSETPEITSETPELIAETP